MSEVVSQPEGANPIQPEGQQTLTTGKVEAAEPQQKVEAEKTDASVDKKESQTQAELKLSLAEGSMLSKAHLEKIETFAKAQGFSQAQAEALLKAEEENIALFADSRQEQFKQTVGSWVEAVRNDKELGGASFDATVSSAQSVVKKFASPEFIRLLNDTGFGNHPEVVRVFARIAKQINPSAIVKAGESPSQQKSIVDVLYDNTPQLKKEG